MKNTVIIALTVFSFFMSLQLLSGGVSELGQPMAESIIKVTSNPFIGLFIGLLITAILQSSSTTTTMAVAFVASESLTIEQALPIIIGANIGTTITSTLVSLSYITKTNEFRKAISAGTSHDLYNILLTIILLPLEIKYHLLSDISMSISSTLPVLYSEQTMFNGMSQVFGPINQFFISTFGGVTTTVISLAMLFATVKIISKLLYNRWIGTAKDQADNAFFDNKYKSFGLGLIVTSIVQSSSLTTSLMVPLAATSKVRISRAFDFILGANLGTTITALIAALFKSEAALSLAIAHFLFNFIGIILFLNVPFLGRLTTAISDKLGYITLRNRVYGFVYILFTFFIIPFALIYFSTQSSVQDKLSEPQNAQNTEKVQHTLEDKD